MRLALAKAQSECPQAFALPRKPEPVRWPVRVAPMPTMADVTVGPAIARL